MVLPSDWLSVLWYALLLVPGAIFVGTRTMFQGVRDGDRGVSAKVFTAFLTSLFFDLAYLAVLASLIRERGRELESLVLDHVEVAASLGLVLGFVIPFVCGWLLYGQAPFLQQARACFNRARDALTSSRRALVPTAWDMATVSAPNGFVRIRISPDVWVGGRWMETGYFSTYPEPRDVFISEPYHMAADGTFLVPVAAGAGTWLAIKDEYIVEWLLPADDEKDEQ